VCAHVCHRCELSARVRTRQRQGCLCANVCRRCELLACVRIGQCEGCLRANERRKCELLARVRVRQREGANTSCWHVPTSDSARAACDAGCILTTE
jgi:hypothetical protein